MASPNSRSLFPLALILSLSVTTIGCNSGALKTSTTEVKSQSTQTITFNAIAAQTVGTTVTLEATASSSLPVSFSSATSPVCSVSGSTANLIAMGTCTIQASQTGDTVFYAVPAVSQSFAVTTSLTYSENPAVYTVGISIPNNSPSGLGLAGVSYSVSPALPAGLSIDTTTGVISGAPTATSAATTYKVSASKSGASISINLLITVNIAIAKPTDYGFPVPNPEPALPSNFDVFTPPLYLANPLAPAVAEWTRSGNPGNVVEFSLAKLTSGTTFAIYGQTGEALNTPQNVTPAVLDYTPHGTASGQIASILLPANGIQPGMYLVFPQNSVGTGSPVAINRTEAWWVGPKAATEGDTVSVYGRNLTYPGTNAIGDKSPLVYLVGTSGSSQIYLPTVSAANPYKVDFSVSGVEPGTYNVWIHNGAGGHFGWSGPLSITVSTNSPWNCQASGSSTFSVTTYGANGNGVTDDTPAVTNTITAAGAYAANTSHPYATVYFPTGTYMVSTGFQPPSNVCFMGAGTTNWQSQSGRSGSASILRLSKTIAICSSSPSSSVQSERAFISANEDGRGSNNVEFTDLVLDVNGNIACVSEEQGAHVRFRSSKNVKFNHIVLNGTGPTLYGSGFNSFDFANGENYYVTNSTIIGTGIYDGWANQLFISDNLFLSADNSIMMLDNSGTSQIALWNNTQEDLEYFNTTNPTTPIPYNSGSASYITATAGQSLVGTGAGPYGTGRIGGSESYETGLLYIGENKNINAGPCDPTNTSGIYPESYPACASNTNANSGEQILFETPNLDFGGLATASSATTVTVSGLTETSCGFTPNAKCVGEDAIIVGGTGLGQNRHIIAQDGATVTISEPWMVTPDTTSNIYIGNVTYQVVVYNNIEQGKEDQHLRYTALTGVEIWSNVYALVYDNNQVSNVRTGINEVTLTTSNRPGKNWIVPNYFNLFMNNSIKSAIVGVAIADRLFGGWGDPQGVAFVGDIYRNNIIGTSDSTTPVNTGIYLTGFEFTPSAATVGKGNTIQGIILDGNSVVINPNHLSSLYLTNHDNTPASIWTDSGNALIVDTLLNNNNFTILLAAQSDYTGPSYGMVFGSNTDNPSLPAPATLGNTCMEIGANTVSGFTTSSIGLSCTRE